MKNKTRILLVSATPKGLKPLRTNREFADIHDVLTTRSRYRQCIHVKSTTALTFENLKQLILQEKPHLVHFGGHSSSTAICFENDSGNLCAVSVEDMVSFFRAFDDEIRCVVFNSCHSEELAKTLSEYIPYVIGVSKEINDDAALAFSKAFYEAIGAGKSIRKSYEIAKPFVSDIHKKKTDASLGLPILFYQNNTEQSNVFLNNQCIDKFYNNKEENKADQFTHNLVVEKAKTVTTELSKIQLDKHKEVEQIYKTGYSQKAINELINIRKGTSWDHLETAVKVTTIQSLAIY